MKNTKLYKKFLSMLTAGILFVTPVAANAENNKETSDSNFALATQEVEYTPLNINEFTSGVEKSYNYLKKYIDYDNLQLDLQCLYYLINREYMVKEDEQELIDLGVIYSTDVVNCKFENFVRAYNLINVINDYNQSVVRKTNDFSHMIDPSELCYNEKDANLVQKMFGNYFMAYKFMGINPSLLENEYYQMAFKQLTTLNAEEKAGNASELSVGARFGDLNITGGELMQLLRDHMQENYSRSELDKYFVASELNKGQWILREDVSLDINCLKNELEVEVFQFGELWTFVYDHVNDDIMKTFSVECNTK